MTWQTRNVSQTNVPLLSNGKIAGAREAQQRQWIVVSKKVYQYLDKPEIKSANVSIIEYNFESKENPMGRIQWEQHYSIEGNLQEPW